MTDGEKMIWAVAFMQNYDLSNPPTEVIRDVEKWNRWELDRLHPAVECAAGAVERARDLLPEIREGFGVRSDVYKYLRAMVEE